MKRFLAVFIFMLSVITLNAQYTIQKVDIVKVSTDVSFSIGISTPLNTVVLGTSSVSIVGDVNTVINGTASVRIVNDVVSSTYVAVTATTGGSVAVGFYAEAISAVFLDGHGNGSFNVNGGSNIAIKNNIGYELLSDKYLYDNPTVNYAVSVGTLNIVVSGYLK